MAPVVALVLSMLSVSPAHAAGTMTATGSSLQWGYAYPGDSSLGTSAGWEAPTVGQATTFTGLPYSNQQRLRVPATVVQRIWKVDGTQVSTAASYTPSAADRGKALSLEVRYAYAGHDDFWWRPSPWTVRNPPLRGRTGQRISFTGETKVGRTVTYPALHIAPTPTTFSVRWDALDYNVPGYTPRVTLLANQTVPYGRSTSLTIPPSAAGQILRACVVATLSGHEDYDRCWQPTQTVAPGDMTITHNVTGNLDGGSRTLTVTGADAYPDANVQIEWTADGQVVPARATSQTSSTLDYSVSLRGKEVKATYTVTAPGYQTVTRTLTQPFLDLYPVPESLRVEQVLPHDGADRDLAGRVFTIAVLGPLTGWDVVQRWTIDGTVVSTGLTYTSTLADAGKQLVHDVVVSQPGYRTFTYRKVFTVAGPAAPTVTGQVDGEWIAGRTVTSTADTSFWAYSNLNPPSFEWQVDGVTVPGAEQRTFRLTSDMVGRTVRVRAHYSNMTDSRTTTSPWTTIEPVLLPVATSWNVSAPGNARAGEPVEITISGVGQTASVDVTWRAGSATGDVLASGTSPRFTPPARLGGTRLHATVTISAPDARTRVDTFAWDLPLLDLPAITPSTTGEPVVGGTVGVSLDGLEPDFSVAYTWYADGDPISGASGADLPVTEAMRDAVLSVRYVVSATGYQSSTGTHIVGRVPFAGLVAPFARLAASSPDPEVGRELTAEAGSETAGTTVTWEWRRDSEVVSTSATYTPEIADAGQRLTVVATLSAPRHEPVTLDFEVAVPLVEITGASVALVGKAVVGQELRADVAGTPADTSVSYTWKRNASVVGSGPTYAVTSSDIGFALTVEATVSGRGYAPVTLMVTSATVAAPASEGPEEGAVQGEAPGSGETGDSAQVGGPGASSGVRATAVLAKKSVKSRKKQTVRVRDLVSGQRVTVKAGGKKIAAFTLAAKKLRVTKRAKVSGAKVVVKRARSGEVTVTFKVGTVVKVKAGGRTAKARKKAKAQAAKRNTTKVLVTGTGGLKARLSFRIR
ncbi:hypothetical protein [Nocardioides campestrisoli]|uniref:hypothetical protein n=1 Tax=Nocardioides campestrisoli TaxID=2736757 RepID=UPI0015E7436A|nr:hypothetical protein [Nocardioides campestrisoli]